MGSLTRAGNEIVDVCLKIVFFCQTVDRIFWSVTSLSAFYPGRTFEIQLSGVFDVGLMYIPASTVFPAKL